MHILLEKESLSLPYGPSSCRSRSRASARSTSSTRCGGSVEITGSGTLTVVNGRAPDQKPGGTVLLNTGSFRIQRTTAGAATLG